jgi:lactate dehydrogenase-like 2-hydroxyacid dehydrogenase
MIGEKELMIMKKTVYLLNTARGAVVDEKALVVSLKEEQIAGAALDVFEKEPKLAPGLATLQNVVLTPHIASASTKARIAMAQLAARNIIVVLENL